MENKIVPFSINKLNLNQEDKLILYSEFDFSNGLLKKPIKEFSNTLDIIFPGDKYSLFKNQVLDLFGIDQNISNKIDENSTINKIFLLEVKILKKNIIKLMEDANPEQENLLSDFLALVNKNLSKVNNILETNTHLPITGITQSGSSLVKYAYDQNSFESINLSSTKNFIITKWLESVNNIFNSNDIEKSINEFIITVFKDNGFKLTPQDEKNISQIIESMCDNLEIIEQSRIKLEVYNKKYISLGLDKSIKSIGSLKKTSILLLSKTFLDKYLDMLLNVVNHKITILERIFGGNKIPNKKYLEYKIKYLLIKKFI
jgi:hypothetical protein